MSDQPLDRDRITKLVSTIFADDLHAKRVASLAGAAVGLLEGAALGIHAIGNALAVAEGLKSKHAVKQVDRLLSNEGIPVWNLFASWVPYVVGDRPEIVTALDWTDFDDDDQSTIVLSKRPDPEYRVSDCPAVRWTHEGGSNAQRRVRTRDRAGTPPAPCTCVTAPRQILPGTTYLITRRCSQRQFLLRPSASTNQIFAYVLALAARRFGVCVHAYCVLSNHFHLVVTDPQAQLPGFSQYLDGLVARAVNASLGRWESFWAPASYSAVALTSPGDVLDKAAYVLANPVAAGLVSRAQEWPGLWSAPDQIGAPATPVARPATFFRADGYLPGVVELELTPPPGFGSSEEFREQLVNALAEVERQAHRGLSASGRGFLGAARVLSQKATARPAPGEPRRELNPRVAARDKWKRIEALSRLAGFLRAYREAWRARRAGTIGVVFPPGTYLLRIAHGVNCLTPA